MDMAAHTRGTNTTAASALQEIKETPTLLPLYRAAVKTIGRGSAGALQAHFELGRIGRRIKAEFTSNPWRSSGLYGKQAVELVALALGMHRSTFYRAIQVAETFTAEQVAMFLKRRSAQGHRITPGHLHVIMPAASAELRERLIEFFYAESPTVPQLAAVAAALVDPADSVTPKVPSLKGAASRFRGLAKSVQTRLEQDLDRGLFAQLRQLADGSDESGPDELALITDVRERLGTLRGSVDTAYEVVSAAEAALEQRLGAPVCA
jgi:hypothetical protein